jgi:hypothetical protein
MTAISGTRNERLTKSQALYGMLAAFLNGPSGGGQHRGGVDHRRPIPAATMGA